MQLIPAGKGKISFHQWSQFCTPYMSVLGPHKTDSGLLTHILFHLHLFVLVTLPVLIFIIVAVVVLRAREREDMKLSHRENLEEAWRGKRTQSKYIA